MAEATVTQESGSDAGSGISSSDRNIDHIMDEGNDAGEMIEGISPPSEAELMGMEEEPKDTGGDDSDEDTGDGTDTDEEDKPSKDVKDAASSESKEEESTDDGDQKTDEAEEKPDTKPPKGFVPLAAIHKARDENKYLKGELSNLQRQVTLLLEKGSKAPSKGEESEEQGESEEFVELTRQELKDLIEEDPTEAILYMEAKQDHRDAQAKQDRIDEAIANRNATADQMIDSALESMEETVPGLLDEDTGEATEFIEFAESIGFSENLSPLTDPNTLIMAPGSDEPMVMGEMASEIVAMIQGVRTKMAERGSKKDTVKAELEKDITARVTKELLAKFKSEGESAFQSVSDLQGTGGDENIDFSGKILTEAELARLSPADYEKYMQGG